jgi:hypothetical protein
MQVDTVATSAALTRPTSGLDAPRDTLVAVPMLVHPLVCRIALAMQAKLEGNKHKQHWLELSADDLVRGLHEELTELRWSVREQSIDEAADVALWAAFTAAAKSAGRPT